MPVSRALVPAALVVLLCALSGPALVLASDLEPVSVPADAVVTIDTGGVSPRELRVTVGDVVEWRNADDDRHRMRSRTGPDEFDSGDLESGERYAIRFAVAGTYPYIDERDDDATAFHGRIVVVAGGTPADPGQTDGTGGTGGTGGSPAEPSGPAATATVVLGDDFVDPSAVRIQAGGSVTFRNQGEDEHSATSTDGGPIDSGVLAGGSDYRATFPDAGTFAFLCIFHSEMQGTVTVVAPTTPEEPAPAAPAAPAATASPDPTPAATATPEATTAPADQVHVDIVDLEFRPPTVTVAAGGLVTWTNIGAAPHTVTASDGSFDSEILEPGTGYEQRFSEPGTFDYLCALHPGMTGTVEVVATSAVATATPDPAAGTGAGTVASGDGDTTDPSSAGPAALAASALEDLAGLILAVVAVSVAVALFAKVIGGTVRPVTTYKPE